MRNDERSIVVLVVLCTYGLPCTVRVISIMEHFDVPIYRSKDKKKTDALCGHMYSSAIDSILRFPAFRADNMPFQWTKNNKQPKIRHHLRLRVVFSSAEQEVATILKRLKRFLCS